MYVSRQNVPTPLRISLPECPPCSPLVFGGLSRPGSSHALKTAFGESVRIIGQCSARKELQYVIFKTSVDLEQLHS
jgi:hypothetical protein